MARTKRDNGEKAYAFGVRVITGYGDYISAKDAWEQLVDKRGVGMTGWEAFQAHLGGAVRMGLLSKKRGEDMKGKKRMLYGPPEVGYNALFEAPIKELSLPLPDIVVEKVQRPNRPSINDIPLGDILSYNHVERDDIMSVIEDLLYDTPLGELRQRYPTLEDLAWSVVLEGGEQ
tara:strand:- start:134 stop:655 length:522 start_codon:yes stop_codon:yes gene_type:complete